MKTVFYSALAALLCFFAASCGNDEPKNDGAYDTVNAKAASDARQKEAASHSLDYKAMNIYAVVAPTGDQMWVLNDHREQAMESFKAQMVEENKWEIQFTKDERRTVTVNWVDSPMAFATAFPIALIGLHVVSDSSDCVNVPAIKQEDAKCVEDKYICYKRWNTDYKTCKKAKVKRECHGIWTLVGYERHYGGSGCNEKNKIMDVEIEDFVCAW